MSEPISEQYRAQMNAIAEVLDEQFNGAAKGKDKQTCFVLLIAPFNTIEGRVNYISNGARRDCVTMLKEILARFEGQPEQRGTA